MKKIVVECCVECAYCNDTIYPVVCVRNGVVWGVIKDKDTIPGFCPLEDDEVTNEKDNG